MSKQTKNLLCHSRRSDFLKILKNFKDNGVIVDFKSLHNISKDVNCFQVYLAENVNFNLRMYKSNLISEINLAEDIYKTSGVTVGKLVRPKKVESFLKKLIKDKFFGQNMEKKFIQNVSQIINQHSSSIFRIFKATEKEDQGGIDFWIEYRTSSNHRKKALYPLQLKTSTLSQNKHKKNHPDIPSLIYFYEEDYWKNLQNLENALLYIGKNFVKEKIIHFDRMHTLYI